MDYLEYRKDDKKIKPIVKLQEEFKYNLAFNNDLLSHKIFYDRNRYYIFPIDLYEIMKTYWCNSKIYINDVICCNKRKDIGAILTREKFKMLIVYYSTSSRFRFYVFTGSETIKISQCKLRNLNLFSFGKWIKEKCSIDKEDKTTQLLTEKKKEIEIKNKL